MVGGIGTRGTFILSKFKFTKIQERETHPVTWPSSLTLFDVSSSESLSFPLRGEQSQLLALLVGQRVAVADLQYKTEEGVSESVIDGWQRGLNEEMASLCLECTKRRMRRT